MYLNFNRPVDWVEITLPGWYFKAFVEQTTSVCVIELPLALSPPGRRAWVEMDTIPTPWRQIGYFSVVGWWEPDEADGHDWPTEYVNGLPVRHEM